VHSIAIVSGGMDSTVLAYDLADRGHTLHLLSFDYGQRHAVELDHAARTAGHLKARWDVIDLTSITALLTGSALTDPTVDVPDGHYAADNMAATVVPNRNLMMLSVAAAVAVAEDATTVATAVHAGDHPVYPDCRPQFIAAASSAVRLGNEGHGHPDLEIVAPYAGITKADIAAIGHRLNVPWTETWSCYKGGTIHCGTCGTCCERIGAFLSAGVPDPTEYLDKDASLRVLRQHGEAP
jgi:7-cyano-7-deazaguanine synthase